MTIVYGLSTQLNEWTRRVKGVTSGRLRFFHAVVPAVAFLLLTTGCQSAMFTQPDNPKGHEAGSSMFPLKFYVHSFDAFCYNTLRCHVIYANQNFTPYKADERASGPPPSQGYRDHWRLASTIGIRNFPPPAEVTWTSLDGSTHEAKVDIGTIFKDQRVLYRVPDSEIPDKSWGDGPSIYLEINDRTINVYMAAFIATKMEQIPGNKDSDFRDDVILAWTHSY